MGSLFVDVFCSSCDRKITLEEISSGFHRDHIFEPGERAALEAVREYLKSEPPLRASA